MEAASEPNSGCAGHGAPGGLRYNQEMRLAEIGEILGVTESRVSQLHAKAVLQVRALLPDDFEPALG